MCDYAIHITLFWKYVKVIHKLIFSQFTSANYTLNKLVARIAS